MRMRLVQFSLAGSGGRLVHVNPEHVVAVVEVGDGRSQIVTTGLQGVTSMTLMIDETPASVRDKLMAIPA